MLRMMKLPYLMLENHILLEKTLDPKELNAMAASRFTRVVVRKETTLMPSPMRERRPLI